MTCGIIPCESGPGPPFILYVGLTHRFGDHKMLGQNHPGASEREKLYVLSVKPQLFIHTDNPLVTNITSAHAYKPTTFLQGIVHGAVPVLVEPWKGEGHVRPAPWLPHVTLLPSASLINIQIVLYLPPHSPSSHLSLLLSHLPKSDPSSRQAWFKSGRQQEGFP